jgi:hypothetical protein
MLFPWYPPYLVSVPRSATWRGTRWETSNSTWVLVVIDCVIVFVVMFYLSCAVQTVSVQGFVEFCWSLEGSNILKKPQYHWPRHYKNDMWFVIEISEVSTGWVHWHKNKENHHGVIRFGGSTGDQIVQSWHWTTHTHTHKKVRLSWTKCSTLLEMSKSTMSVIVYLPHFG